MGFTKLHNCILNSSIWNEEDHVRIVWVTMLAMADEHGEVKASLGGLSHQARKSIADTTAAIKVLESPDTDSSRPEFDGRRIEKTNGGWQLLNHSYYRELGMTEAQREYWRVKQRKHRASRDVNDSQRQSTTLCSASASVSVPEGESEGGVTLPPAAQHDSEADELPALTPEQTKAAGAILAYAMARGQLKPLDRSIQKLRAEIHENLLRGLTQDEQERLCAWCTDPAVATFAGVPHGVVNALNPDKAGAYLQTMRKHRAQIEQETKRRNK